MEECEKDGKGKRGINREIQSKHVNQATNKHALNGDNKCEINLSCRLYRGIFLSNLMSLAFVIAEIYELIQADEQTNIHCDSINGNLYNGFAFHPPIPGYLLRYSC